MRRYALYCLVLLVACSCTSPQKAFDKGNYGQALSLASKKVKKGKNIVRNTAIIKSSSARLVDQTLATNTPRVLSAEVKDWIKARDNYYRVLEDIGKANTLVNGQVSSTYDKLCSTKNELDFEIVDHFYTAGLELLDESRTTGNKEAARLAHAEFLSCSKNGGEEEFYDLPELTTESVKRGMVYFIGWGVSDISESFWRKRLPRDMDKEQADCEIDIDLGLISVEEVTSTDRHKYTENIQTGSETVIDTSGISTSVAIYEDVVAYVITTKVTLTASSRNNIDVRNLSGQCNLSSYSFTIEETGSYEVIEIEGDDRAVPSRIQEKRADSDMENDLKSAVYDGVRSAMADW